METTGTAPVSGLMVFVIEMGELKQVPLFLQARYAKLLLDASAVFPYRLLIEMNHEYEP